MDKTKELIIDFRRRAKHLQPLTIKGTIVERTDSYKFLGLNISESLSWAKHTIITVKKAQQRLHFIRVLKKARLGHQPLTRAYKGLVESVLTCAIAVWYGNTTVAERKSLQCHQSCRESRWLWPPIYGNHIHTSVPARSAEHSEGQTPSSSCPVSVGELGLQPETQQTSEHQSPYIALSQQLFPSHHQTNGIGHQGGETL